MDVLPERTPTPSPSPDTPHPDRDASAGALAIRRICPYLAVDGASWRSAHPAKEHRCGAVTPMAPLAPDKQRRLCLTDAHRICATFTAARQQAVGGGRLEAEGPGTAPPLLGNDPDGTTVTRWSLVRTTPVLLDQRRVPVQLGSLARDRRSPQLMLGGVMVLAFLALVATRLSGPTTPAAADGTASPTASPTAAPTSTPRPTARRTATPPPSIAPTGSVVPATPAPTAAPTVAPSRTPPPATRSYTVRAGDTLYAIAIRFGTTVQAIRDLNGLGNSSNLHIGQVLRIP